MKGPGPSKLMMIFFLVNLIAGLILTWFITYRINAAFWIGLGIIIIGEVLFALGYFAMREHPERKQVVVDWGVYRVSRHSHVLASIICLLGVVIMGWSPNSLLYIIFWVYFILNLFLSHYGVLNEEKLNIERFGKEYADYIKRTPRYFFFKKGSL
jgi:protein-S-isoprenylcysteine O-methyltransferase Ste14